MMYLTTALVSGAAAASAVTIGGPSRRKLTIENNKVVYNTHGLVDGDIVLAEGTFEGTQTRLAAGRIYRVAGADTNAFKLQEVPADGATGGSEVAIVDTDLDAVGDARLTQVSPSLCVVTETNPTADTVTCTASIMHGQAGIRFRVACNGTGDKCQIGGATISDLAAGSVVFAEATGTNTFKVYPPKDGESNSPGDTNITLSGAIPTATTDSGAFLVPEMTGASVWVAAPGGVGEKAPGWAVDEDKGYCHSPATCLTGASHYLYHAGSVLTGGLKSNRVYTASFETNKPWAFELKAAKIAGSGLALEAGTTKTTITEAGKGGRFLKVLFTDNVQITGSTGASNTLTAAADASSTFPADTTVAFTCMSDTMTECDMKGPATGQVYKIKSVSTTDITLKDPNLAGTAAEEVVSVTSDASGLTKIFMLKVDDPNWVTVVTEPVISSATKSGGLTTTVVASAVAVMASAFLLA